MAEPNGDTRSRFGRAVDGIEETFVAVVLGAMTLITFANVVARYVFNDNILWALEATLYLFAWLVLIGISYGVKKSIHLGVDVVVNACPAPVRRLLAIVSVIACLAFAVLLVIGAWNYWLPFVGNRAWYEVDDIQMPSWLQFLSTWLNEGERYSKLPRFIPYFALPLGMSLLLLRYLQVAWHVVRGRQETLIASHEVEDVLADRPKLDPGADAPDGDGEGAR